MNFQSCFKAARMSRVLMGGAALMIAIGVIAPIDAYAQKAVKGDGSAVCDFSAFSFNSSTNTLQVTCTSTQTTGASVYSVSSTPISTTRNTNVNTTIFRNGGGSVAETLTITHAAGGISGWNFNGNFTGSQTINFAIGEMSKTLTFYSGPTDGFLTFTLAGVSSSVGSTASGSQTFNVSGDPPPAGGGGGTIPGCSTSATKNEIFQFANQKIVFSLKAGETGAVAFTPSTATLLMYLSTTETINTPPDADHEVTVSTCPGDFNVNYPCRYQANYVGSSMQANTSASAWQCPLIPGKTYYMNVRQIKLRNSQSDPIVNSCVNPPAYTNGACEVRLQNTGL